MMADEGMTSVLVDTHCHVSDDPVAYSDSASHEGLIARVGAVRVGGLVCMSTNERDQDIVAQLAQADELTGEQDKVVPCFGWHPWFTHQISLTHPAPPKRSHYTALFGNTDEVDEIWDQLIDPISLHDVVQGIRDKFQRFPKAMLGEVGIDRAFRIPRRRWNYDPQQRQPTVTTTPSTPGPKLTKLKTPQEHQLHVLRAQIDVALEHRRNVSLHSVQAAGLTVDLLASLRNADPTSFGAIRISIHSCSLDPNVVRSITKTYPNVYYGFSPTVNAKQFRLRTCLQDVPLYKALLESDYHTIDAIPRFLSDGVDYFADYHNLSRIQAAQRLAKNWKTFYSNHNDDADGEDSDDAHSDDDGPPVF